jgi:dipeptide/tripeptide permease
MWFSLSFVYYGINFLLPTMVIKMRQEMGEIVVKTNNNDMFGILLAVLSELPSNHLAIMFIENHKIGRKRLIAYSYLICAFCCFTVFFSKEPTNFFFFLISMIKFFINISF